jgi:hypothetical protein
MPTHMSGSQNELPVARATIEVFVALLFIYREAQQPSAFPAHGPRPNAHMQRLAQPSCGPWPRVKTVNS